MVRVQATEKNRYRAREELAEERIPDVPHPHPAKITGARPNSKAGASAARQTFRKNCAKATARR